MANAKNNYDGEDDGKCKDDEEEECEAEEY